MKQKIIGLIPTRLNSRRLPAKALLPINNIPLIVHVYRRAKLCKNLDDVFICCDDSKVLKVIKKFGAKGILTSKHHTNGTERICEGYKKIKKKFNFVIDIQGDEPLISPNHIDQVINYHIKNSSADIIIPNLKVPNSNNTNLVKIVSNKKNEILYISRANVPYEFKNKNKNIKKHLSIISFLPEALIKYCKCGKTAVLNMASSKRKGGGVENGSMAQEECLFRCSNLFTIQDNLYPIQKDQYIR